MIEPKIARRIYSGPSTSPCAPPGPPNSSQFLQILSVKPRGITPSCQEHCHDSKSVPAMAKFRYLSVTDHLEPLSWSKENPDEHHIPHIRSGEVTHDHSSHQNRCRYITNEHTPTGALQRPAYGTRRTLSIRLRGIKADSTLVFSTVVETVKYNSSKRYHLGLLSIDSNLDIFIVTTVQR